MASVAATPASMQMSIDGNSTICRESSLLKKPHKAVNRPPRRSTLSQQQSPSTAASIPSRYQTYFFATTERKGFNSQAARFTTEQDINENPGPGTYGADKRTLERISTSFSKKGTGGFASKSRRFVPERRKGLGPASYNPRPVENRIDFNKVNASSNFKLPIAVKPDNVDGSSQNSPAPNTYNLSGVHTGKNSTVSAEAAFKSKSKREVMIPSTNPAPCQYTVEDSVLHPSPRSHKSVFNSKSHRGGLEKAKLGPGPADYTPVLDEVGDTSKLGPPKQLPYYRQKHYLCISAPAMPLPPLPPTPGPGHYETQSAITEETEKKLVSGAVFKSTTSRWLSTGLERRSEPGPGTYDPVALNKQSYLYNVKKKWI